MIFYFSFLLFLISLTALIYASWTDFKSRIVPDWLNYLLLLAGLILHLVLSILSSDYIFFLSSIAAVVIAFAFSFLLWRMGVWAGGDVKLFTALAAANPVNHAAIAVFFSYSAGSAFSSIGYPLPIFPFSLFAFSILSMLPYAILLTVLKLFKRKDLRDSLAEGFFPAAKKILFFSFFIIGFESLLVVFGIPSFFYFPLVLAAALAFSFASKSLELPLRFISVFLFAFSLYSSLTGEIVVSFTDGIVSFLISFSSLLAFYLLFRIVSLMRSSMRKNINVNGLEEGMIAAEFLVERDGRLFREKQLTAGTILNNIKTNSFSFDKIMSIMDYAGEGIVLASPRSAGGVTVENLLRIKKLAGLSGISEVAVTESAPFVPAVLLGYLALQVFGDVLWRILFH